MQVLSLHPDAGWLHIGCDEVYQLGQCPICSQKLLQANTDPENAQGYQDGKTLFLQHVYRVGNYVKKQKNVIPIIWDDMLRTFPAHILQDSKLGEVVEPMVWVYVEDVDRFVDALTWTNYGEVFSHIWAASAYKGEMHKKDSFFKCIGYQFPFIASISHRDAVSHCLKITRNVPFEFFDVGIFHQFLSY